MFDLHTSWLLTLTDIVADSPVQLSRRLCAAISWRQRNQLATLYGIFEWDTSPSRVFALDTTNNGS